MPFGLKNTPAHFQRTVNQVFYDLLDVCVLVYLDDILIFSKSWTEHQEHVCQVFERLNKHGFCVKISKCELFLERVEFLGHQVSAKGVEVTQNKVKAVAEWPVPKSVRHVQQFLGLCNYFRRFIPQFARLAQPMTDLTRKNVPFRWDMDCQAAFGRLKACLQEAPVLMVFDPNKPVEVWCDALDYACGAVLV